MRKEYVKIPIGDLIPYENNPRKNDTAVPYVAESIKQVGYITPIIVDENNVILAGHTRLKSLLSQNWEGDLDVLRVSDLTEEQKKKFRLLDNKTNEFAEWDFSKLEEELEDLDFGDFDFDFGTAFMDDQEDETPVEEDETPEVENDFCKAGDLWLLGNHRLICGDSTDAEVIDRLMDGVKADMVFTDSPYGINAVGNNGEVGADFGIAKKGKYKKIIADDTTETAQKAYNIYSQLCDKMILWGGNYFLDFLPASDGWLIWDKRGESGIRNTFADGEMAWCSFHTPVRIYHQLWNGMIREGEHEKRVHPTQKPIRMLSEILKDFTNEGDIILDVFGGSGSTLIACEQLNRKCFMVELDPHYCSVIVKRYVNLKGGAKNVYLIRDGKQMAFAETFPD